MKVIINAYENNFVAVITNFYAYKKITGERFNDKLLRYKEKI